MLSRDHLQFCWTHWITFNSRPQVISGRRAQAAANYIWVLHKSHLSEGAAPAFKCLAGTCCVEGLSLLLTQRHGLRPKHFARTSFLRRSSLPHSTSPTWNACNFYLHNFLWLANNETCKCNELRLRWGHSSSVFPMPSNFVTVHIMRTDF